MNFTNAQKQANLIAPPADFEPESPGFGIRFCAFIIDFACVWLPWIWLIFTYGNIYPAFALLFVLLFIPFAYHTLTIGRWEQTLGNFLAGMQVVAKNGEKIGYLKSFVRTLLWYLYIFLLLFGLFFEIDGKHPALGFLILLPGCSVLGTILQTKIFYYDYICGTRVVYKKPTGLLRKTIIILLGITVLLVCLFNFLKTLAIAWGYA